MQAEVEEEESEEESEEDECFGRSFTVNVTRSQEMSAFRARTLGKSKRFSMLTPGKSVSRPNLGQVNKINSNMCEMTAANLRSQSATLVDVVATCRGKKSIKVLRCLLCFAMALMFWKSSLAIPSFVSRADATPNWPLCLTLVYGFACWACRRFVSNRSPLAVYEALLVFVLFQLLLHTQLAFSLAHDTVVSKLPTLWDNTFSKTSTREVLAMLHRHYLLFQVDMIQTMFKLLSKDFHLIWLHMFDKIISMWTSFFLVCVCSSEDALFPAAVSTACTLITYFYYAVSMMDLDGLSPKLSLVMKGRLREVQLAQQTICALYALYVTCIEPSPSLAWILYIVFTLALACIHIDFEARRKHGDTHFQDFHVTFCFDSSAWLYCYHWGVAAWLQEHVTQATFDAITQQSVSGMDPRLGVSGSSGGALVAFALGSNMNVNQIFEHVLDDVYSKVSRNPWRLGEVVRQTLERFLPNSETCRSVKNVRVLLSRVSFAPPFIAAEVIDRFADREDAIHNLMSTSHIPGINLCPYRHRRRYYFDGMMWASWLAPWQGMDNSYIIRVSALGPFSGADVHPPILPLWWGILPPPIRVLRGLYWKGYVDIGKWFEQEPTSEKQRLARSLLACPQMQTEWILRRKDPITGDVVADLIEEFECAVARSLSAVWIVLAIVGIGVEIAMLGLFALRWQCFLQVEWQRSR